LDNYKIALPELASGIVDGTTPPLMEALLEDVQLCFRHRPCQDNALSLS
jgi:hypothetical protein